MFQDKQGQPMDFAEIVVALLVEERGHSQENAERLVKTYTNVITNGIMGGMNYRATAIALEMVDASPAPRFDDQPTSG